MADVRRSKQWGSGIGGRTICTPSSISETRRGDSTSPVGELFMTIDPINTGSMRSTS